MGRWSIVNNNGGPTFVNEPLVLRWTGAPERAPMPAEVPDAPSVVEGMAETVESLSSSAVRLTAPVPPEVIVTVAPGVAAGLAVL